MTLSVVQKPMVDLRVALTEGLSRSAPVVRRVAQSSRYRPILGRLFGPFNPSDFARADDLYPAYERLRQLGPVYFHPRFRTWFVTGHAEAEQVLQASSSANDNQDFARSRPYRDLDPQVRAVASYALSGIDQPGQLRLRRLLAAALTPETIARLEPKIDLVAHHLLDTVEQHCAETWETEFDAMADYAAQLPVFIIGELLGLSRARWRRLTELADVVAALAEPQRNFDPIEMNAAVVELTGIFDQEVFLRRGQNGDGHDNRSGFNSGNSHDVLSLLASAEANSGGLTRQDLHGLCLLLLVAGHRTTSGLIGNALVALDQDRHARARLRGHPDLAENAVDEFLRFDSPFQVTRRRLAADVVVAGRVLRAGSDVTVFLGAANRDPRVHDRAGELLLDRFDPNPLSLGHSTAHLTGLRLTRLVAKVAIPVFIQRFPTYVVDRPRVSYQRSAMLRGPASLPVSF